MTLGAIPSVTIVAVCTNGKELLSAIDTWHPDVILTDIRMPPSGADEGIRVAASSARPIPMSASWCSASTPSPPTRSGCSPRAQAAARICSRSASAIGRAHPRHRGGGPRRVRDRPRDRRRADRGPLSRRFTAGATHPARARAAGGDRHGKSNGAIAESLVLTKRAVEKHVNSIFAKLDLTDSEDVSRQVEAALIYLSEVGQDR